MTNLTPIFIILFLAGLISYTYLLYPLILPLMLWVSPKKNNYRYKEKDNYYPSVSMIISAYNEEKNIKAKIDNFLSLDYPEDKIELLMGSDGSTDWTAGVIKPFISDRIKLFEFRPRRGKASVINDIIKEAKGEIVIFSDADTIYDKDAIKKLVSHFADRRIGGVCGRLVLYETGGSIAEEGLYWRYENFIKEKESQIKTIVSINGQIFAIRKNLFRPVPANSITEDQVLGMDIVARGHDILFDKEAVARERIGTLAEEFRRRERISAGNFQSITYFLKVLNPKAGFASFALWSHKILRWFAPFFLIAIFVMSLFLMNIPLFKAAFYAQAFFYLLSVLYYVLNKAGLNIPFLRMLFYFNVMNLAILIGFMRFITNTQRVAWDKVR